VNRALDLPNGLLKASLPWYSRPCLGEASPIRAFFDPALPKPPPIASAVIYPGGQTYFQFISWRSDLFSIYLGCFSVLRIAKNEGHGTATAAGTCGTPTWPGARGGDGLNPARRCTWFDLSGED
jgi:hypothetical protein